MEGEAVLSHLLAKQNRGRGRYRNRYRKDDGMLDRIVAMLTKLGQRGYAVHEGQALYTARTDPDSDPDPDGNGEETDRQQLPRGDA